MRIASLIAAVLVAVTLGACSHFPQITTAAELCKSWRHQTVDKADKLTQGTAEIAEGNNKARPAWGCAPGKDQAAGAG